MFLIVKPIKRLFRSKIKITYILCIENVIFFNIRLFVRLVKLKIRKVMANVVIIQQDSCLHVGYLHEVVIKCKNCGKPVVISPNNATFVNAEMGITKLDDNFDISRIVKCHCCGHENHVKRFLKKSNLKQIIGQIDLDSNN